MKVEFKVKLTIKEMFSFLINNAYRKPMGVIMFLFGIGCFVVAGITCKQMELQSTLLLILLGSIYTIIQPIMLWKNAGRQIAGNPVYKEELSYSFDDKGITVSQGENITSKGWDECYKAADYGKIVVIYITVNNGIILPKTAIGEQYGEFVKLVGEHLPGRLKHQEH